MGRITGVGTYSSSYGHGIRITPADLAMSNIQFFFVGAPEPLNGYSAIAHLENWQDTNGDSTGQWVIKLYSSANTEVAVGYDCSNVAMMSFFAIGDP